MPFLKTTNEPSAERIGAKKKQFVSMTQGYCPTSVLVQGARVALFASNKRAFPSFSEDELLCHFTKTLSLTFLISLQLTDKLVNRQTRVR